MNMDTKTIEALDAIYAKACAEHPEVSDTPPPEVRLSRRQRRLLLPPPTESQVERLTKWARPTRQQRRASQRAQAA